jgi:hypothetical protein
MLKVQILKEFEDASRNAKVDIDGDLEDITLELIILIGEVIKVARKSGLKEADGSDFDINSIVSMYKLFKEDN